MLGKEGEETEERNAGEEEGRGEKRGEGRGGEGRGEKRKDYRLDFPVMLFPVGFGKPGNGTIL